MKESSLTISLLLGCFLPYGYGYGYGPVRYGYGENSETIFKNENGDKFEELIQRMERMDIRTEKVEKKLEAKNTEVEDLQKRVKEMEVQLESRMEEVMLNKQQKKKPGGRP